MKPAGLLSRSSGRVRLTDLQPFNAFINLNKAMQLFRFQKGYSPVLICNAGSGVFLPPEIASKMTEAGQAKPDTDWYLTRLCDIPAVESVAMISANVANCVVDLNADPTGGGGSLPMVCRTHNFDGQAIYEAGQEPDSNEIEKRIEHYWQPFHNQLEQELERLINRYGFVLLIDMRAIPRSVPTWFEGDIASFNFNTLGGNSCGPVVQELLDGLAREIAGGEHEWTCQTNGNFPTGYVTRHYSQKERVHCVQLGLDRLAYLEEDDLSLAFDLAQDARNVVENVIVKLMRWAESHPARLG